MRGLQRYRENPPASGAAVSGHDRQLDGIGSDALGCSEIAVVDGPDEPSPARIYSYWLGGSDYRECDRNVAETVIRHRGQVVAAAHANRAFLRRLVWYAASGSGICQFLDIGAGLPASNPVHEIAHRAHRKNRTVYVDIDPYVVSRGCELLTAAPGCAPCVHAEADLRDPVGLLACAAETLDFTEPVAVLLLAVLDHVTDEADPAGIVTELAGALAPGSLLAISHLTADYAPDAVHAAVAAYNEAVAVPLCPRSGSQVLRMFGGLPLQWPGVVPVTQWLPAFQDAPGRPVDIYGGVARVPPSERRGWHDIGTLASVSGGCDSGIDRDELNALAARHPGFCIWEEVNGDRRRYVARGPTLTLVSDSLDEISEALAQGT
jgi:S-adenosyl methyltransferase